MDICLALSEGQCVCEGGKQARWEHDLLPSKAWEAPVSAPAPGSAWALGECSPVHTEQGLEVNE